jgi:hypothetical protein
MKKILLSICICFCLLSCTKPVAEVINPAPGPVGIQDPTPTTTVEPKIEASSLVSNWYLTSIFNYATPIGKTPKNATITIAKFVSFLGLEANGIATLSNIGIGNYGFDPFTKDSFKGTFALDKNIVKIIVTIGGQKYVNYFKVKSVSSKSLVLFQDKALFLKALEENKTTMGDKAYKSDLAIYNENDRYESEVTLGNQ